MGPREGPDIRSGSKMERETGVGCKGKPSLSSLRFEIWRHYFTIKGETPFVFLEFYY